MPLHPFSKEIVMDLSEAPGHVGHRTCSLLMCIFISVVSGLQPHITMQESVGHSFKLSHYNHKHTKKENNDLT